MELFKDFNNRTIVFIRFNPDGYTKGDKKVPSSFKYHKTLDIPAIRDKKEWTTRIDLLKQTIDFHLVNIPTKELTIEKLFYDD